MDQKKIRFLKGLSTGLVIVAIVFAFLIAGIRIFGIQVFGVLTGSMEPAYPTGSLIYVKDVDPADLRVNDVITFSISPGVIATHRIVELVPDEQYPTLIRYRTKGDANRDVDANLVSAGNIIGKAMFAVPQLGYLASYIQQAPGIYVAILVCGLMIAFVFYTDSLEEKQQQQIDGKKSGFDLTAEINKLSQKLLGKDIIPVKAPPEPLVQQGYVPSQQPYYPQQYPQQFQQYPQQPGGMPPMQYPQGYPQQPYPQYYQPAPQQGYPQNMQQTQPQYPVQYYQQQVYPQQGYPQQMYQQPMQGMPQNMINTQPMQPVNGYAPQQPQNPGAGPMQ